MNGMHSQILIQNSQQERVQGPEMCKTDGFCLGPWFQSHISHLALCLFITSPICLCGTHEPGEDARPWHAMLVLQPSTPASCSFPDPPFSYWLLGWMIFYLPLDPMPVFSFHRRNNSSISPSLFFPPSLSPSLFYPCLLFLSPSILSFPLFFDRTLFSFYKDKKRIKTFSECFC